MNHQTNSQLLRAYAEVRSEAAFAELVRRHVDLVHSAALRMVRDSHLAQDVTQGVFVALAKNAAQLTDRPVLSGWLHRTAQNIAAQTVRTDVRRRAREQEAAAMNALLSDQPEAVWEQVAPLLDAALGELSEPDRDALLLRYFERRSAHEMAQTLGVSDEAAQKRVSRAVERLREFFARQGISVGVAGLVVTLTANAVQAAPVGLAVTISSAAALAGISLATTATASATKAIVMTTLQKSLTVAVLAVSAGVGIYEARQALDSREQVQTLRQRQAELDGQIEELRRERDEVAGKLQALREQSEQQRRDLADLPRLRGEVTRLRNDTKELAQLKAAGGIPGDERTQAEVKSWLTRVNQLKQRLEQKPDAKIPELQFVTEQDWLNAAKSGLETDADYRRALSELRRAGENKLGSMIQTALKKYSMANSGGFPADLTQLQPYFESPMDPALLDRWQIAPGKTVPNVGVGEVIITQKAPVDDVFDTRLVIGPNGSGSTDFLSTGTLEVLKLVFQAYDAAHNGKQNTDLSQLQPYAKTPEQQSALQKLILRESARK